MIDPKLFDSQGSNMRGSQVEAAILSLDEDTQKKIRP